jgi:hypothetical protein
MQKQYALPLAALLAGLAPAAFAQHGGHAPKMENSMQHEMQHDLQSRWVPSENTVVLPVSPCDVGESACAVALPEAAGGGKLIAEITPRPIEPLAPFAISAKFEGIAPSSAKADFSGVKMDMGPNEAALKPDASGRHFTGRAIIPICRSGKMRWQMTLLVEAGGKTIVAPFQFSAAR